MSFRRSTELAGALALLFVFSGCGAAPAPSDGPTECAIPDYFLHEWVLDGVRGSTGCIAATGTGITRSATAPPNTWMVFGFENRDVTGSGLPLPELFCGVDLQFFDIIPETGGSGELVDASAIRLPCVVADLAHDLPGEHDSCAPPGGATLGTLLSGTWHVIRGGTWGDRVEVEARDVRFTPVEGHDLTFERMYWNVSVSEPSVRP